MALTGVLVALLWMHRRHDSHSLLRGAGRSSTTSRSGARFRHGMVFVQAAMASVLLCGSGLLVRSFWALNGVELGFRSAGLLTFRTPFPFREIRDAGPGSGRATRFYSQVAERPGRLPGVTGAAFGECLPLDETCELTGVPMEPVGGLAPGMEAPVVVTIGVSPKYHELLGIPLLRGRNLDLSDADTSSRGGGGAAVVVSRNLAARFWPTEDAIGKQLRVEAFSSTPRQGPFTVVGVVGDVNFVDLRVGPQPVAYFSVGAEAFGLEPVVVSYVLSAERDLAPTLLKEEVRAVRPDVPVAFVRSMDDVVSGSTHRLQFVLGLVAAAAFASLVLTAVGIYGITAYVVRSRRGEFGVRVAIGATPGAIRRMVVRQVGLLSAGGLLIGLLSSLLANRYLESLLFGVDARDGATFASVLAFLMGVTISAAYLPARSAVGDSVTRALGTD